MLQTAPAGAQSPPLLRHTPSATHCWPPQSAAVLHGLTVVPPRQVVGRSQGPEVPHTGSEKHVLATAGCVMGKY